MILLKNWKFLNAFFLDKKGLLKVLGVFFYKAKKYLWITKMSIFECWKNGYFPKGLTHGLEQKSRILKSFVLGQEKRSIESVLFICYIEKNHIWTIDWNYRFFLWSKNWHFVMWLTHDFGKKLESFKFVLLG